MRFLYQTLQNQLTTAQLFEALDLVNRRGKYRDFPASEILTDPNTIGKDHWLHDAFLVLSSLVLVSGNVSETGMWQWQPYRATEAADGFTF